MGASQVRQLVRQINSRGRTRLSVCALSFISLLDAQGRGFTLSIHFSLPRRKDEPRPRQLYGQRDNTEIEWAGSSGIH